MTHASNYARISDNSMSESLSNPHPDASQPQSRAERHHLVEPNRRLIALDYSNGESIEEYADLETKERLIALPLAGKAMTLHQRLARRGIPVFPYVRTEASKALLEVPADARSVSNNLRFIARDVDGYAPTFRQLGDLMARVQASGFGLPKAEPNRRIFHGLAIAADDNNRYGSGLTLVPPYVLDENVTKRDLLAGFGSEMMESNHFTLVEKDFLLHQVHEGWNDFRH